jgi:hypothetical protein
LLTARDDRYVIADAIRVEQIANLSPEEEIQVTMGGETGVNIADGAGNANFGTVDFNEPMQKTFTISNRGTADLTLTLPITVVGSAFTVVQQPPVTTIAAGQSTTFVMEMSGATTGGQTAAVSFGASDGNEHPFDFTVSGTVRTTNIIDDGDPGFFMSPAPGEPGGWGQAGGPGREFDYKYNRNTGVEALVTWTFNVTPGVYRVSTTWPFGFSGYDDAAPYTIYDGTLAGGVLVGSRNINQKLDPAGADYPPGFMFPAGTASSTAWERIADVNITGTLLTVAARATDAVEFVLVDSVLIDRLGNLPPSLGIVSAEESAPVPNVLDRADFFSGGTPGFTPHTGEENSALVGTTLGNDEVEELAAILAEEATGRASVELSDDLGRAGDSDGTQALDLALADWVHDTFAA